MPLNRQSRTSSTTTSSSSQTTTSVGSVTSVDNFPSSYDGTVTLSSDDQLENMKTRVLLDSLVQEQRITNLYLAEMLGTTFNQEVINK